MSTRDFITEIDKNNLSEIEKNLFLDSLGQLKLLYSNLTSEGRQRLDCVSKDVPASALACTLSSLDPLIGKLFFSAYCENPDHFKDIFAQDLIEKSKMFTFAVFKGTDGETRDGGNDNENSTLLKKQAEYLWNNCPASCRQKLKQKLSSEVTQTDNHLINSIKNEVGKIVENMPIQLELMILDGILTKYKLHIKNYKTYDSQISCLSDKKSKYEKLFTELSSDDLLAGLHTDIIKQRGKVSTTISQQEKSIGEKREYYKALMDLYKKYFDANNTLICNICMTNQIKCAGNCGHLFCRQCIEQLKTADNDDDDDNWGGKICPYCNGQIHQFTDLYF